MPYRRYFGFVALLVLTPLLATRLSGQTAPTLPAPPKTTAKPAVKPPFKLYDWMGFNHQPDLRPLGFEPIWGVMDGTFNRATTPEADNVNNVDPERSLFAARRQAVAAAGVLPLLQNTWNRPKAYAKLRQDMVFDLEGEAFKQSLDMTATSEVRSKMIAAMCGWADAMREEAAKHGHTVRIGSYFPIGPFYTSLHPKDPRFAELKRVAENDFKPWLAKLDFSMPDCSIMGTDVAEWKTQVNQMLAESRRYLPGKPVYAEMQLCYAHFTKDVELEGTLVDYEQWSECVTWLAQHPGVAGICLFGHDLEVPGADRSNDPGNTKDGTRRLDYRLVEKHVRKVAEVGAKRRAADLAR
jgi:hypothetical protein